MGEYVDIPSTMWTVISQARRGGQEALEAIFKKYRPPVYAFIRNTGFPHEDAEDLTQEVFLALVKDDVLEKADKERGKFRSLLLAVTRHAISTKRRHDGRIKRGGGAKPLSLSEGEDHEVERPPQDTVDEPHQEM